MIQGTHENELAVYREALLQITGILRDESICDPDCFARIERIVRILEDSGFDCGVRHDF